MKLGSSFKNWLASDEKSTRTRCTICHKVIELSSSGRSALTVRASGKKHADAVAKVKNFFKPRISLTKQVNSTTESQPEDAKQKKQQTLDNISFDRQSTIVEIICILKTLLSGHSMRSNDDLGKTFAAMFPQLKSLYNFNLACTKCMYVINHGLASFFKTMLNDSLQKSNIHVFCFDESLNEVTQTCKMDMYIRYWNDNSNTVNIRCYGSSFLGHATNQDLLHHFNNLTKDLDPTHLYQISMDSLIVNMKFLRSFRSTTKNVASID